MIKLIDNNNSLYKPEKAFYLSSLDFAKKLPESKNKKIIFHCFWRVPKEFGRKQLAVLKSIIVNHGPDIEINLWSNVDLSTNPNLKEILPRINLKLWDLEEEIKGTILEECQHMKIDMVRDRTCYSEGDVFRLLVLQKYGGFYIDMDVLILRNFSPLNDYEFLYQWGTSGFNGNEPNITMNGAVMKLDKGSKLSDEFLELLSITPPSKDSFGWGNQMYSRIVKNDLLVLPGIWFNSEWGFEGTSCNPFQNVGNVELFDGAFAWHWHNRWDEHIQEGSKFEVLEKLHNKLFSELQK
jgi:hypothetical protein